MRIEPSGFLTEFDRLQDASDREVAFIPDAVRYWEASGIDWAGYTQVLVEPVEWRPVGSRAQRVGAHDAAKLCADFEGILRDRLGRDLRVVDVVQPGTLAVRAAVTDVATSNVLLNIVALIVLFPVDMGGIRGEIELVDATTREPLAALAAYREGTPLLLLECFSRYGHARHGMRKWARMLDRTLQPQPTTNPDNFYEPVP